MTQCVDGKQQWLLMVFHQAIRKQRKIMCTQIGDWLQLESMLKWLEI